MFRVTWNEAVTGGDLADLNLTTSGTSGNLQSLTTNSSATYDITVTSVSGDGTLRLNLDSSGTGITDLAGNPASGAHTSGQTYTVRLAGSGVWIDTEQDDVWSDSINWDGGVIASGAGATADLQPARPNDRHHGHAGVAPHARPHRFQRQRQRHFISRRGDDSYPNSGNLH